MKQKTPFMNSWNKYMTLCHPIKLILRGMNVQIKNENAYKSTIEKHSLHNYSNDNGIRLINFAIIKNMVLSST